MSEIVIVMTCPHGQLCAPCYDAALRRVERETIEKAVAVVNAFRDDETCVKHNECVVLAMIEEKVSKLLDDAEEGAQG